MKKFLLMPLLFANAFLFAQSWQPMGPDDHNTPVSDAMLRGDMVMDDNNNPYVLSVSEGNVRIKKYNGAAWENTGPSPISNYYEAIRDFAVDHEGSLYATYTNANDAGKASAVKFNGTSWEIVGVGGISEGEVAWLKIVVDNNNVPYLLYSNTLYNGRLSVKKFNGAAWVAVGDLVFSASQANYATIAFDNSNVPYVAYQDAANNLKITVQKFDGSLWTVVGNPGITPALARHCSLAFDSANHVWLSSANAGPANQGQAAMVQMFNGTNWVAIGDPFSLVVRYTKIQLDSDNNPYVFVHSQLGIGLAFVVEVKKFVGTSWVSLGTFSAVENYNNTDEVRAGFQIGTDNQPVMMYSNRVRKYNGTWQLLGTLGIQGEDVVSQSSAAIDNNNETLLAYTNQNLPNYNLFVKRFSGNTWQNVGAAIDATNSPPKLVVAPNNTPYIAFVNGNPSAISVKKFNGTSWEFVGQAGFATPYGYISLAIDPNNVPYVAYPENALDASLTVKKFNGTDWVTVGIAGFSPANISDFSIVIDNNNVAYASYTSNVGNSTVTKFNGTAWQTIGTFPDVSTQYGKLSVDHANNVYLMTRNNDGFYEIRKFDGTNWNLLPANSITGINHFSLQFDYNDVPHILYDQFFEKASLIKLAENSWESVGGPISEWESYGGNISLLFTTNNTPIAVYSYGSAYAKYYGDENALGTHENNFAQNGISIYPNPVKNNLTVSSESAIQNISIFDMTEKKVFSSDNGNPNINIEFLQNGLYILKVKTDKGIFPSKIIKE